MANIKKEVQILLVYRLNRIDKKNLVTDSLENRYMS